MSSTENNQFLQEFDQLPELYQKALIPALLWLGSFQEKMNGQASRQYMAPLNRSAGQSTTPKDYTFETLSEEQVAKYRQAFVSFVWEPGLRAELVTRAIWAIDQNFIDADALDRYIASADENYKKRNNPKWRTLGGLIHTVWNSNGLEWTATANVLEPKPAIINDYKPGAFLRAIGMTNEFRTRSSRMIKLPGGAIVNEDDFRDEMNADGPINRRPEHPGIPFVRPSIGKSLGDIADVKGMEDIRS